MISLSRTRKITILLLAPASIALFLFLIARINTRFVLSRRVEPLDLGSDPTSGSTSQIATWEYNQDDLFRSVLHQGSERELARVLRRKNGLLEGTRSSPAAVDEVIPEKAGSQKKERPFRILVLGGSGSYFLLLPYLKTLLTSYALLSVELQGRECEIMLAFTCSQLVSH